MFITDYGRVHTKSIVSPGVISFTARSLGAKFKQYNLYIKLLKSIYGYVINIKTSFNHFMVLNYIVDRITGHFKFVLSRIIKKERKALYTRMLLYLL